MAVDYKASSVEKAIIGKPILPFSEADMIKQVGILPSAKLEGEQLRLVALQLATWKTYRTAASGNQTIELAEKMAAYIVSGAIPK